MAGSEPVGRGAWGKGGVETDLRKSWDQRRKEESFFPCGGRRGDECVVFPKEEGGKKKKGK